ncbi:RNA polymerase sigma factor [Leifsonia sp. NPDC058230]|uniref:RNA polymerase sigma factor n=1 Tax=Leifsonia sp. NPDC058230 TaxID=3346391 RepID=UPI0036DDE012
MDDEDELWQRARRDDGAAFAALFDLHHARVYRRALALLGDVHDADDIAAAAFFELWRKRRSVPLVSGSVLPWLLVTTVNLSRNSRRGTARYRALLRDIPHPLSVAGPDAEQLETSRRLTEALGRLAPVDAALFVLTVLEELPVAAAAQTVGLKAANARVRLHRARTRLRVELHDLNPDVRPIVEGSPS